MNQLIHSASFASAIGLASLGLFGGCGNEREEQSGNPNELTASEVAESSKTTVSTLSALKECPSGQTNPAATITGATASNSELSLSYGGTCRIELCWDGAFREGETISVQLWATEDEAQRASCDPGAEPERRASIDISSMVDKFKNTYPSAKEVKIDVHGYSKYALVLIK